ncbi:MAG: hypothetical protein ACH350_08345 [Parachlamydiaceae bacterium]
MKKQENLSFSQTSKRFGLAVNTLFLWSKNLETKGTRHKAPIKIHDALLLEDVQNHPDVIVRASKTFECQCCRNSICIEASQHYL